MRVITVRSGFPTAHLSNYSVPNAAEATPPSTSLFNNSLRGVILGSTQLAARAESCGPSLSKNNQSSTLMQTVIISLSLSSSILHLARRDGVT